MTGNRFLAVAFVVVVVVTYGACGLWLPVAAGLALRLVLARSH